VERLAAENEKTVVSRGVAVVLLLSSAVMAFIGMALMMWYNGSLSPRSTVFYPALYLAVFDFFCVRTVLCGRPSGAEEKVFPVNVG